MCRRLALLLVAVQSIALAEQQPQAPVFRSSTLLIVQAVIVKDRKGNPIEGLTARDFIVTEDGVPQDLAFVEYQKLDTPPLGATGIAPTVAARPASTVAPVTAVGETLAGVPLPGDTRYRGKRLIVLYLDLQSLSFFDEYRVYSAVRKYLDTSMTAADLLSVVVYETSRVRLRQDFTDDREALHKLVDDLERATTDAERGGEFAVDSGSTFGEDAGSLDMFSMDRRLAALQTTVTNLGPLPELKTLVYFGGGLDTNTENLAQMRATVNAAVRANVTINPIDTRGLQASVPMGGATRPSPGGVGMSLARA